MTVLAEVRDGARRAQIRRNAAGGNRCSLCDPNMTTMGNCRHVLAYQRAVRTGSHMAVRDAQGTMLVWLQGAPDTPSAFLRAAYALATELLPSDSSAGQIQSATRKIVDFTRDQAGVVDTPEPRGKRAKTRKILLVDTLDG